MTVGNLIFLRSTLGHDKYPIHVHLKPVHAFKRSPLIKHVKLAYSWGGEKNLLFNSFSNSLS